MSDATTRGRRAADSTLDPTVQGVRTSDTTTRGIRIEVHSEFLAERSSPREEQYLFQYHVRISNVGTETAQLVSREWIITNADGEVERVKGPGVVGEKPVLPARRPLRVHQLLPAEDAGRLDAGQLPDGDTGRHALRRGHLGVHARRTTILALSASAELRSAVGQVGQVGKRLSQAFPT